MFGSDGSPIVQYVVIFAVIFAALAAIVFVVRRLTGRGLALPGRSGGRGRQPRLGIVDVYELDRARQLILLRRDNVEHLLLVGGPNDVVVERNIQRGQRPLPEASLRPAEPIAEPLPDPLSGAGRLPEPQRPLPEIAGRRSEPLFEPGFEMPVVVPAPVPGSGAAPAVTLPLDAGLIGGDEPGQDLPVGARAVPAAPQAAAKAPAAREPFSARRILQRTAPALLDPRPEPASERVRGGEPDRPPEAVPPMLPPLAVPGERRAIDPAVLSDMARQLQAALARPSSAVAPAPAVPVAPAAAPAQEPLPPVREPPASEPPDRGPEPSAPSVDPVAAAMAAPPAGRSEPAASVPEATPPRPAPPPPVSAPRTPGPAERPAPPAEQASVDAAPAPPALVPEKAAGNPFSVEEIEAEFARLLGRPLDKRG